LDQKKPRNKEKHDQNTMAATAAQGAATSSETTPILIPEPMIQIITSLSVGTSKSKAKEPAVYRYEQHKLQGWLAQLIVHYRTVGWQKGHDEEEVLYAISLLREDGGTWISQYAEQRISPTWETWAGFKAELQRQFGLIDSKGEARIKLKNRKQGK